MNIFGAFPDSVKLSEKVLVRTDIISILGVGIRGVGSIRDQYDG